MRLRPASTIVVLLTLAAGVAHELGTPLGTIAVAAKELQRAADALGLVDSDIPQDAALIRSEVDRCRQILDQMAEPSASSLGEDLTDPAWADLEADLAGDLSADDRQRVSFLWPSQSCGPVPRKGLVRAARAVLANALEATPQSAGVAVSVRSEGGGWCLEVADQGSGMAPEVLARVGEPFFSTKPTGSGMGLGLFLARTFAEQLGGALRVESTVGRGTTVHLAWPQLSHG